MHFSHAVLALALCATGTLAAAQPASSQTLTLAEAVRLAQQANANVLAKQAQLAAAEGERSQAASPLFNNPEVSLEQSRRRAPGAPDTTERTVGLSQQFEIAGQQGHRRAAADATLQAVRAELDAARRQASAEAATRFYAVLAAERRLQLEQRAVDLFERTSQAVGRRRAAGEDTRLDANVAVIEAERARSALAKAREQAVDAATELAATLQLPPSAMPQASGDLATPPPGRPAYSLDHLIAGALALPRQTALAARLDAAQARLAVARASRLPGVTLGVSSGREGPPGARERVTTFAVSVPLPLFNRNQAGIGQALTDVTQAEIERSAGVRDAEAQVRRLWQRLQLQVERVQRLQRNVMAASLDNQQLAARSRQAGQIGLLEQLLVNRQALDAERELIDALAEYQATRIELESTAGWPQEGTPR